MQNGSYISLVLNAHLPFIRHPETAWAAEERFLFERLSNTYIPFLKMLDHLDSERIPFRIAVSLSPTLCHMLRDDLLINRYLAYVDRQIEFGLREMERTADNPETHKLARMYYDKSVDDKILFTERYENNLLAVFELFQKKGKVEFLTTAATHAFLPFYANYPESIQSQIEVALASHRTYFGKNPQGFWLPEMGWAPELDEYLRAYNMHYTVVNVHGLLLGSTHAKRGSFYPIRSPAGIDIFSNDFYSGMDLWHENDGFTWDPLYRDYHRDVGYDIPCSNLAPFIEPGRPRIPTGYKYWAKGRDGKGTEVYNAREAQKRAREHARIFLDRRAERLSQVSRYIDVPPISVCTFNLDVFGHYWYEGISFLEQLLRETVKRDDVQCILPGEYASRQPVNSLQAMVPEFSSWGVNGYAETWLDSSNDWVYSHISRSINRMIELAERFPDDTGLKERALNQAAREILLIQASDWPGMISCNEHADYAKNQLEISLRNFTTIYEALGSNYISTEWLTNLEKKNNIFPSINYRVFRKKK